MLKTVGKGVLFTAGTACISYAVTLLESDVTTAITLIILGAVLIVLFAYFLEKQSATKAAREVYNKLDKRLKDLERKRSHKPS